MDISSMYRNSQYNLFKDFIKDLPEICDYKFDVKVTVGGRDLDYSVAISLVNHEQIQRRCVLSTIHDSFESITFPINLSVYVFDKTIEETKQFTFKDIIQLPIYHKDGMKIRGNRYVFSNLLDPAKGWQFDYQKRADDDGLPVVSLRPERFSTISVEPSGEGGRKKYVVKKRNGQTTNFYILLKAFSGMTEDEIVSMCSSNTDSVPMVLEPLREEGTEISEQACKRLCLDLIGIDSKKLSESVIDYNFKQSWVNNKRFRMSDGAFNRLKYMCSFSNRCLNCELANTVCLSNGEVLVKGTLLTSRLLETIDADSNILELYVKEDIRVFRVVKYPIMRQLDINTLANITNMLCCEIDGLSRVSNIDELSNKQSVNVYSVFKEYVDGALETLSEGIIRCLNNNTIAALKPQTFNYVSKDNRYVSKSMQLKSSKNSVSSVAAEYKVISSSKNTGIKSKEVLDSHINFLDSVVTPESKKAGTSLNLVSTAFSNKDGELCNYFQKVVNGELVENEIDILTVTDCYKYKISNIRNFTSPDQVVEAKQYYKPINVKARELDYVIACPASVYSRFNICSVFINHNDGRRVQVTGNQMLQYVPILGGQEPPVATGMMSMYDTLCTRVPEILEKICVLNNVSYEDSMCSSGIYLCDIKILGSTRTFFFKSKLDKLKMSVGIPTDLFNNINQMVSSESLNCDNRAELEWFNNEIVIKPIDVKVHSSAKINSMSNIDYGAIKSDDIADKICEQSLKPGKPLTVCFTTWKGYGFEDGIVLSESVVNSYDFANICVSNNKLELSDTVLIDTNYNNESAGIFNGLVAKNTKVEDGDPLIAYRRFSQDSDGNSVSKLMFERVGTGHGGFVQSVNIVDNCVEVVVSTLRNTQTGDKYTGFHGNKGVSTVILPENEMPKTLDGRVLDIIVNVQGVPSRENIGQLFETDSGQTNIFNDGILVASPAGDNDIGLLKSLTDKYDLKETRLIDPVSCRVLENSASVGEMYFVKLEHQIYKKHAEINYSNALNSRTNQPDGSSTSSAGQSISELTQACILANGCTKTLDYMYSANSDDVRVFNKVKSDLIKYGTTHVSGTNRSYGLLSAYFMAVGYDMVSVMDGKPYTLLTDKRIAEISQGMSWKNNTDYILFNNEDAHYDLVDSSDVISAGSKKRSKRPSTTKYTHIEAGKLRWVNPAMVHDQLIHLLLAYFEKGDDSEYRFMSRPTITKILDGNYKVSLSNESDTGTIITIYNKNCYIDNNVITYTGGMAILKIFENFTKQDNLRLYSKLISDLQDLDSLSSADEELLNKLIKRQPLVNSTPEYKDLILNKLLMIPLGFRPHTEGAIGTDTLNVIYRSLHKTINRLNKSPMTESRFNIEYTKFYKALLDYCMHDADVNVDPSKKNLPDLISDKDSGLIRNYVLRKRVHHSGRSTIIGVPWLPIHRAAIPVKMFYVMYKYPMIHWLLNQDEQDLDILPKDDKILGDLIESLSDKNWDEVCRLLKCSRAEAKDVYASVFKLVNKRCVNEAVLLVREPSLHRQNCQCFVPLVVEGLAVGISALITGPFNADFDGDQMAVYAILNKEAMEESLRLMSPKALLHEDREGNNAYSISQDMVLGIYSGTLKDPDYKIALKEGVIVFESFRDIQDALVGGRIKSYSTVSIKVGEHMYTSTPGRLLVNSVIPYGDGFSNGKLKYNSAMNKGAISKLIQSYLTEPADIQLNLLNQLKDIGFCLADINNTTISTNDFISIYDKLDLGKRKLELKNRLDSLDILKRCGLVDDVVIMYKNELDSYEKDVVSKFKSVCGEDSNFGKIFNSGSRGSFRNLAETLGYVGFVVDLSDKVRPNMILNSLFEGLNGNEVFTAGVKVRHDQISTVDKTSDAGYLTRLMTVVCADTKIIDEDCGAKPTLQPVHYTIKPESLSVLLSNLVGNILSSDSDGYSRFGSSVLSYTDVEMLASDYVKKVKCTNGFDFSPEYSISQLSKDLLIDRVAYNIIDNGEDFVFDEFNVVTINHQYLKCVEKFMCREVPVRTSLSCLHHPGVCATCYGKSISRRVPVKVGESVGTITAQTVGEPTAQLAISARNYGVSDDTDKTSVVRRVTALLNKQEVKNKKLMSIYCPFDETDVLNFDVEKGYKSVQYGSKKVTIKPTRLTIGYGCKVRKGELIIKGLNDFNELEKFMDFGKQQQLLLQEYYQIYISNGVILNAKHFETLVKAQSDYCKVIKSSVPNIKPNQYYCIGDIQNVIDVGGEVEYTRLFLNLDDMNRSLDVSKAVACKDPFKAMSLGVAEGRVDMHRTVHGSILCGKPIGYAAFRLKRDKYISKANVQQNVKESNTTDDKVRDVSKNIAKKVLNRFTEQKANIFDTGNEAGTGLTFADTNIFIKK